MRFPDSCLFSNTDKNTTTLLLSLPFCKVPPFSFQLKDMWKATPIVVSFQTPKHFLNNSHMADSQSFHPHSKLMHKRSIAWCFYYFIVCFLKILAVVNWDSFSVENHNFETYTPYKTQWTREHYLKPHCFLIMKYGLHISS